MPQLTSCLAAIDNFASGSKPLLLVTGYDGALCPTADPPAGVVMPRIVAELLRNMINSGVVIAVISGRPLDDLVDKIRLPIILAGDNGLRIQGPGLAFEHAGAKALRPMLAEACHQLHQTVAKWEGAFVEDKSLTGIVHYPKVDGRQHRGLVHEVRRCLAKYGSHLGVRTGQGAIEIHPRVEWDKGSCLAWIKQEKGLEMNPCVCIGSDPSDESMFAANSGQLNIKVGLAGRSAASFRLTDVSEVAAVLAHLEQVIQPGAARLA